MQVWAIAHNEQIEGVREFRDAFDIDMPILYDETGEVASAYRLQQAFPTGAYPHDWVIGTDGNVAYANNRFEPDEMIEVIEAELRGE